MADLLDRLVMWGTTWTSLSSTAQGKVMTSSRYVSSGKKWYDQTGLRARRWGGVDWSRTSEGWAEKLVDVIVPNGATLIWPSFISTGSADVPSFLEPIPKIAFPSVRPMYWVKMDTKVGLELKNLLAQLTNFSQIASTHFSSTNSFKFSSTPRTFRIINTNVSETMYGQQKSS